MMIVMQRGLPLVVAVIIDQWVDLHLRLPLLHRILREARGEHARHLCSLLRVTTITLL